MKKVTVFKGVINGREFDNVADYNAAFKKLMDSGETDIQASSSTSVKTIEDESSTGYVTTCTADQCPGQCIELPEDEDFSFYPYMENDDPCYLDLLVTEDKDINQEAFNEAVNIFSKCYPYIKEALNNPETTNADRYEYLEDVRDILNEIAEDAINTNDALDKLNAKRNTLISEFEKVKAEFEKEIANVNRDVEMLVSSQKVINLFGDYYHDIETETLTAINNAELSNKIVKRACGCDDNCGPDCKCTCHDVETSCKEVCPTAVHDFNSLLERIFGTTGLIRR